MNTNQCLNIFSRQCTWGPIKGLFTYYVSQICLILATFYLRDNNADAVHRKMIGKILKEGREARQRSAAAQASTQAGDNADSICWFCHIDVSNLENSKCAGCRKVTPRPQVKSRSYLLFFKARYCGEACQRADWERHGDYCVKAVNASGSVQTSANLTVQGIYFS